MAREDYDNLFFVRPHATGAAMLQDRTECRKVAQGIGGTASSYSNPQYGALNAMGSALDEDALHEGGLHKRLQIAIIKNCMERHGWTSLQPQGDDARAVRGASLGHTQGLDAWLKAHEPATAPAPPPGATAAATASGSASVAAATGEGATPAAAARAPHLYAVTFDVSTDANGKVSTLSVSKVTDPFTGTTDPIKLDVPGEFVAASRDVLLKRQYEPNKHFSTYSYYDPERPSKGDINPSDERGE
jgi:hypothetical protein